MNETSEKISRRAQAEIVGAWPVFGERVDLGAEKWGSRRQSTRLAGNFVFPAGEKSYAALRGFVIRMAGTIGSSLEKVS